MRNFTRKFERIRELEPRRRGMQFEMLFYNIFEVHGILEDRSYKNEDGSQQIDGSIVINNKIFIVETKWERTETLASEKLLTFIGKINSKIEGTLGLFISYNKLSRTTIDTARGGIKQNCIIIHGEGDILSIVRGEVSVADYIWYIFKQASTRNKIFAPITEFKKAVKKPIPINRWNEVRDALISEDDIGDFEWKLDKYYGQIEDLPERAISLYPTLKKKGLNHNINYLFNSIINDDDDKVRLYDALINKLTKSHWIKYAHEDILDKLRNISGLNPEKASQIVDNILPYLNDNIGQYEEENKVSLVLDFIYEYLSEKYINKLACAYTTIYCDTSRRERFPQKRFSKKIFNSIRPADRWKTIIDKVLEKMTKYKADDIPLRNKTDSAKLEYVIGQIEREFGKIIEESQPKNLNRQLKAMFNRL